MSEKLPCGCVVEDESHIWPCEDHIDRDPPELQKVETMFERLPRRLSRAELLAELRIIADARPETWEPDMRGQFQAWAQSRARDAIRRAEGGSDAD